MKTRYPIVLAHGVAIKDVLLLKAFAGIEKKLKKAGHNVYTAKMDAYAVSADNAAQLKEHILKIMETEGVDKVNIIAHSKGGLDSKYMIEQLDMAPCIASLTTLCTPYKGSALATKILSLPKLVVRFLELFLNLFYRILGDKKPDALAVGQELSSKEQVVSSENFPVGVYCRSYSAAADTVVTRDSAAFADYRGDCMPDPMTHTDLAGWAFSKKKRAKVYDFYISLCNELAENGF